MNRRDACAALASAVALLSLPKTGSAKTPSVGPRSGTRTARLTVPAMHCITPTEPGGLFGIGNTDDEVYFLVASSRSGMARYPSADGYYHGIEGHHLQEHGWSGHLVPKEQNPPVLWQGDLADGEEVRLAVSVVDQDNEDLHKILSIALPLAGVIGGLLAGQPDLAKALIPVGQKLASLVSSAEHELIGTFGVSLRNEGGRLIQKWAGSDTATDAGPNPYANHGDPDNSRYFAFDKTKCRYNMITNGTLI